MDFQTDEVLIGFAFQHKSVSEFDTDILLRCLHITTDVWKDELKTYSTGATWTAQKRRKVAENFRDQILNELLRRFQDAIHLQNRPTE